MANIRGPTFLTVILAFTCPSNMPLGQISNSCLVVCNKGVVYPTRISCPLRDQSHSLYNFYPTHLHRTVNRKNMFCQILECQNHTPSHTHQNMSCVFPANLQVNCILYLRIGDESDTLHAGTKKEKRDSENMNASIKYTFIFIGKHFIYIVHIIHTLFTC